MIARENRRNRLTWHRCRCTSGNAFFDCLQTGLINKQDIIDGTTARVLNEVRKMLQTKETIKLVGHSQGGAIVSAVAEHLSPEERARVDIVTIGGAAIGFPKGMKSVTAYVNTWDIVPMAVGAGMPAAPGIDANENTTVHYYQFGILGHMKSTHSVQSYLKAKESRPAASTPWEAFQIRKQLILGRIWESYKKDAVINSRAIVWRR